MAERMVFDDLRKSMGKSLIWAHEPKELRRKSTWKSVKFCPNCGSWASNFSITPGPDPSRLFSAQR